MTVRVFEAEPTLIEIDISGNTDIDHPLQWTVENSPADVLFCLTHQVDQIVGSKVSILPKEDVYDQIAFTGTLAADQAQASEVGRFFVHEISGSGLTTAGQRQARTTYRYTPNDEPHPQVDLAFGFLIVNPPPVRLSTKSTCAPFKYRMLIGST
jgi:hypothetical protein